MLRAFGRIRYALDNILNIQLTGLNTALSGLVTSSDTIIQGFSKLQNQHTNVLTNTQLVNLNLALTGSISVTDTVLQALGRLQNQHNNLLTNTLLAGFVTTLSGPITTADNIIQAFSRIQNQHNNLTTNTQLTNLDVNLTGSILATDTILQAFGKIQRFITNVLNVTLTGLVTTASGQVTVSDTILQAIGRLQNQHNNLLTNTQLTGLDINLVGSIAISDTIIQGFGKLQHSINTILANATLTGLVTTSGGVLVPADTALQAFGKLENRMALNDVKVSYPGLPTFAQVTAKPTTMSGFGLLDARSAQDFITGLELVWVDATHIQTTPGMCWIPSLNLVYNAATAISCTLTGGTANTNYHVYIYDATGTPTLEMSTTAPSTAAYYGTARTKTSDNTRRYLGAVRTDATGNIINFVSLANSNTLDLNLEYGSIVTGVVTDGVTIYSGDFAIPLHGPQVSYLYVSGLVTLVAADDTWQSIKLGPNLTATVNPGGLICEERISSPATYAGIFRTPISKVLRLCGATTLSYSRVTTFGTTGRSLAFAVHGLGIVR